MKAFGQSVAHSNQMLSIILLFLVSLSLSSRVGSTDSHGSGTLKSCVTYFKRPIDEIGIMKYFSVNRSWSSGKEKGNLETS